MISIFFMNWYQKHKLKKMKKYPKKPLIFLCHAKEDLQNVQKAYDSMCG